MKNRNTILGMIFGAGIGIIFNSTGLGLPIGAGVGLVLGLILNQLQKNKINNESKINTSFSNRNNIRI